MSKNYPTVDELTEIISIRDKYIKTLEESVIRSSKLSFDLRTELVELTKYHEYIAEERDELERGLWSIKYNFKWLKFLLFFLTTSFVFEILYDTFWRK